jgi:DNA-binding transcriptional LysR family regulator
MTLTAAGSRLLEQARSLAAAADALDATADAEARRATRLLRVGVLDFHPLTAVLAGAGRALPAPDPPLHLELIDLPWLAHTGAVLNHTIDVGFTLTVDRCLPAPDLLRSTPLRAAHRPYALLPAGHPLAAAGIVDPLALAKEPLHLPRRDDNREIYDLVLELLADAGLTSPRLAPTAVSFAAVLQHIAAGDGWTVVTAIVGPQPVAGTIARPLAASTHRKVHLEMIWHRNTDTRAVHELVDQIHKTLDLKASS